MHQASPASRHVRSIVVFCLAGLAACGSHERQYELRGQVLAVDPSRQTLTITHEDIVGFMPGMTMPFRVSDPSLLEGRRPGDLVRATLVVEAADAYLVAIEKTGWMPVEAHGVPPGSDVAPLAVGDEVPDQDFLTQDGTTVALSTWRGQAVAVTFIYTRCPYPTFCPLMDRHFRTIQARLTEEPTLRGRAHLLSLSFDPEHDTPAVLRQHAASLGADGSLWTFATTDTAAIDRFGARLGLTVTRNPDDSFDITHSLSTAVIGPDGRLVALYRGNDWTPDQVLSDLRHASFR